MLISARRPQALVVEDDDLVRRHLQSVLAEFGFVPSYAQNATLALRVLEHVSPAFILTDIYMPGGDGLELIGSLRRRGDATPIIAMSGGGAHPDWDVLRAAAALGADACIGKPIRNDDLLRLIGEVLQEAGAPRRRDRGASPLERRTGAA